MEDARKTEDRRKEEKIGRRDEKSESRNFEGKREIKKKRREAWTMKRRKEEGGRRMDVKRNQKG